MYSIGFSRDTSSRQLVCHKIMPNNRMGTFLPQKLVVFALKFSFSRQQSLRWFNSRLRHFRTMYHADVNEVRW